MVLLYCKFFERDGSQGSGIPAKYAGVVILRNTAMRTSNQTKLIFSEALVGKGVNIDPAYYPYRPARKTRPKLSNGASFSGIQRTHRLRARATIVYAKNSMKEIRRRIEMRRATRAVDAAPDVHHGSGDTLSAFMLAVNKRHFVEERSLSLNKEWIKGLLFHPYYFKMVDSAKYGHLNPYMDAYLIPCKQRMYGLIL